MKKVLDEKCPNCGAPLKYNPTKDKFTCQYCKGEFTLKELEKQKEKQKPKSSLNQEFSLMEEMNGYHCENCGAVIVALDNITSTTCIYCKSNAIIKNRLSGVYKPDSIIPFKYKKEDAINEFLKICSKRILLPHKFNQKENIADMEGLYVPFFLYDVTNNAEVKADCTKVATWMDSRNVYTKTSYYKVLRGGKLTFLSVPNDAATRFDDTIMNAIEPFNYKDLKDFNPSYLAGFLSEKYDVSKEDAYQNAIIRIKEDSKDYLRREIIGYATTSIIDNSNELDLKEVKYVLLPVYVLNIKYKNKIYHFAMNGQTGKLVGEIPVDNKKLLLLIITVWTITALILVGIFLLLGYRW